MEVKTLLRLIKEDVAHLEGITGEYDLELLPSTDEVELTMVRAKALLRELELLHKIAVQHESRCNPTFSVTELPAENQESSPVDPEPFELFSQEKVEEELEKEEFPEQMQQITIAEIQSISQPVQLPPEEIPPVKLDPEILAEEISSEPEAVQEEEIVSFQLVTIDDEVEPIPLTKKTLGETLGDAHQLVNDILAPEKGESGFQLIPISTLWDGIGINDRFLYERELFGNNNSNFKSAVEALDQLGSIQEAVGYLKLNFKWNKSEASQKFLNLVKRRFTK